MKLSHTELYGYIRGGEVEDKWIQIALTVIIVGVGGFFTMATAFASAALVWFKTKGRTDEKFESLTQKMTDGFAEHGRRIGHVEKETQHFVTIGKCDDCTKYRDTRTNEIVEWMKKLSESVMSMKEVLITVKSDVAILKNHHGSKLGGKS